MFRWDPSYPQDRIDYLIADTKAALVLTQQTGEGKEWSTATPRQGSLHRHDGGDLSE